MSSPDVIALAAVVSSGLIGVASLGFSFWNSSRERDHRLRALRLEQEERYRVGLYEKRLQVHQQAYKWLMDLIEPLREAMADHPHKDEGTYTHSDLASKSFKAREWWDGNCLYLDDGSRLRVVDFIEEARSAAECESLRNEAETMKLYRDALRAVEVGIGMKHLDVKEPKRSVAS
jgi:hypothetical protein